MHHVQRLTTTFNRTRSPRLLVTLAAALASLWFASSASAQLVTVPSAAEGNLNNIFPFAYNSTLRYQQVYDSSLFSAVTGSAPISQLAFRPDGTLAPSKSFSSMVNIRLSTTSLDEDGLNSLFANNSGPDETVVFSGTLPWNSGYSGTPGPFSLVIPLTVPFVYTPAAGNLLLDVTVTGFSGTGGYPLDAVFTPGDGVSRLYFLNATSTFGFQDTLGLVTQFTFDAANPPTLTPVPEPSTYAAIASLALMGAIVHRRRGRRARA